MTGYNVSSILPVAHKMAAVIKIFVNGIKLAGRLGEGTARGVRGASVGAGGGGGGAEGLRGPIRRISAVADRSPKRSSRYSLANSRVAK
ncbi:unnamed protein product [Danaus chrysippus]|uniref:(African queen) hypothetical protein n=1 Tax=Danaus chrysippus TaxID=151541 RepID=A0A8J2VZ95_9NEOP|nr:unnamed protein product [Danaus chrysippus]